MLGSAALSSASPHTDATVRGLVYGWSHAALGLPKDVVAHCLAEVCAANAESYKEASDTPALGEISWDASAVTRPAAAIEAVSTRESL